jgi:hypothetical protein
VVLHRPDDLLRGHVFLAATQHLLKPHRNFQSHASRACEAKILWRGGLPPLGREAALTR